MPKLDESKIGDEVTIPVIPTVGDTEYQQGELTMDIHQDGVELHIDFGAGPVHLWMRHDDSEQLRELL